MFLYVEFSDTWNAYNEAMMGLPVSNCRRIKKIKLTEEQIKELQPRRVGLNGGKEVFEQLNVLSIQEE